MSRCGRCGAEFGCGMREGGRPSTGGEACWCASLALALPLPASGAADAACWCPACLGGEIARRAALGDQPDGLPDSRNRDQP